jgi:hypothetical protein
MKKKKPTKPKLGYTDSKPVPAGSIVVIGGKCFIAGKRDRRRSLLGMTKRECARLERKCREVLLSNKPITIAP